MSLSIYILGEPLFSYYRFGNLVYDEEKIHLGKLLKGTIMIPYIIARGHNNDTLDYRKRAISSLVKFLIA